MSEEYAGDASVPALMLVYGDAGVGKTTDTLFSFSSALFLPVHEDAIRAAATTCGYRLRKDQVVPCRTLSDSLGVLLKVRQAQRAAGRVFYPAFVVDDVSQQAKNELRTMQQGGKYNTKKEGAYDRAIWGDLMGTLQDVADVMRYDLGGHAVLNAHRKQPAEDDKGIFTKGGPDMPARSMVKDVPHLATSVYRAKIDPTWPGEHKGVYECRLESDWHMKCRLGWRGVLPMNLAELLRTSPLEFDIPRHEDVAWIEPLVKAATKLLLAGEKGVAEKVEKKVGEKWPNAPRVHIDWIMRDAVARSFLLRQRTGGSLASRWGV